MKLVYAQQFFLAHRVKIPDSQVRTYSLFKQKEAPTVYSDQHIKI